MTTHVIILAQGQQSRLPDLTVPKQMLDLPACGDIAIIERTLCQLALLGRWGGPCACYRCVGDGGHHGACTGMMVTVVCGGPMVILLPMVGTEIVRKQTGVHLNVGTQQLADPGNSSLKGISRFLDLGLRATATDGSSMISERFHDVAVGQTVVLLGDVVYSWACLRACFAQTHWHAGFVGTKDLSRSAGELWGINWTAPAHAPMMRGLTAALATHPPFEGTYQPGQMRRWLWAMDEWFGTERTPEPLRERAWFTAVDDYTMDVDLPAHVPMLKDTSVKAAADDREHGLVWTP